MPEAARVYADALFEAGKDRGKLDSLQSQLAQFADAVDGNRELQVFLFSPYLSSADKREGLGRAISGAEPELTNFLELLIENHRMPVIYRARRQFEALWDVEHRLLPVEVTSAVALDPAVAEELGSRIREQTGQNVELTSTVDPDILGGIVLRVGNSILDASISNRLQQLRREVAKS